MVDRQVKSSYFHDISEPLCNISSTECDISSNVSNISSNKNQLSYNAEVGSKQIFLEQIHI